MKRLQSLWIKNHSPLPTAEVFTPAQLHNVSLLPALDEVKHRVGKSSQHFTLENWNFHWEKQKRSSQRALTTTHDNTPDKNDNDGYCVGRFVSNVYGAPAHSYSWGVWDESGVLKNIGAYRMHDGFGNLLAYRLDILKDVKTTLHPQPRIEFLDLIVDCWLWPNENGEVRTQDVSVEDLLELDSHVQRLKVGHNEHMKREEKKLPGAVLSMADAQIVNDKLQDILSEPQSVVVAIDTTIAKAQMLAAAHDTMHDEPLQ